MKNYDFKENDDMRLKEIRKSFNSNGCLLVRKVFDEPVTVKSGEVLCFDKDSNPFAKSTGAIGGDV